MASKYLRAARAKTLIAPGNRAVSAPVTGSVLTVLVTFATWTVGQTAVAAELVLEAELEADADAAALALELAHFLVVVITLPPPLVVFELAATTAAELLLELDEL